jgi:hypothetical protein
MAVTADAPSRCRTHSISFADFPLMILEFDKDFGLGNNTSGGDCYDVLYRKGRVAIEFPGHCPDLARMGDPLTSLACRNARGLGYPHALRTTGFSPTPASMDQRKAILASSSWPRAQCADTRSRGGKTPRRARLSEAARSGFCGKNGRSPVCLSHNRVYVANEDPSGTISLISTATSTIVAAVMTNAVSLGIATRRMENYT